MAQSCTERSAINQSASALEGRHLLHLDAIIRTTAVTTSGVVVVLGGLFRETHDRSLLFPSLYQVPGTI